MAKTVKAELMSDELVDKLINAIPEEFRKELGMHTLSKMELMYLNLKKNTIPYELLKQKNNLNTSQWNPLIIANINSFINDISFKIADGFEDQLNLYALGTDFVNNRIIIGKGSSKYTTIALEHNSLIHCAEKINRQMPVVGSCMGLTNLTAYLASQQGIPLMIEVIMPSEDDSGHIRLALQDGTPFENTSIHPFAAHRESAYQLLPLSHLYILTLNNLRTEFYNIFSICEMLDDKDVMKEFLNSSNSPEYLSHMKSRIQESLVKRPEEEIMKEILQVFSSPELIQNVAKETANMLYLTLNKMIDELPHVEFEGKQQIIQDVAENYLEIAQYSSTHSKHKSRLGLAFPVPTVLMAYESCNKLYNSTDKPEGVLKVVKQMNNLPGMFLQHMIDRTPCRGLHTTNRINIHLRYGDTT